MVILNPNVAEDQLEATTQRVSEQVTARGGQLEKVDAWGRRRMYYSIKGQRDGHYVVLSFQAEPTAVRDLENTWRISEDVLRHLVIRTDA
jgi:small subunit ribosomal protein S6